MDGFLEFKDRNVIPIWRDFRRTSIMGELEGNGTRIIRPKATIERAIQDWKASKSIGTAADLINSAFISGIIIGPEIDEAIRFTQMDRSSKTQSLFELVGAIEKANAGEETSMSNVLLELNTDDVERIQRFFDSAVFFKILHRTRELTRTEIRNPIAWVELARLYSTINSHDKAERAMAVALQLSPDNRFVLRAATQQFILVGKAEKALFYLRQTACIEKDPWLMSAQIATSSSINRFSKLAKPGFKLVESKDFSPFALTELASSLGTLEFKHGEIKKAKRLFKKSLSEPNDNSLAQLRWIAHSDRSFEFDPFAFQKVVNPFEAYAFEYFSQGKWKDAYDNCIRWLLDTPYSATPAAMASYLAVCILYTYKEGITICEVGLKANVRDPVLLNNIVFAHSVTGKFEEADRYVEFIKALDWSSLQQEHVLMLTATLGLAKMRKKEVASGKQYYLDALDLAKKLARPYYRYMVVINFTRELLVAGDGEKYKLKNEMDTLKIEQQFADCIFMRREVQKMFALLSEKDTK